MLLLLVGAVLLGSTTAANSGARYAATDLARRRAPGPLAVDGGVGDHDRRGRRPQPDRTRRGRSPRWLGHPGADRTVRARRLGDAAPPRSWSASCCGPTRCCVAREVAGASPGEPRPARPGAARGRGGAASARCWRTPSPGWPAAHAVMVGVMVMTPLHMEHGGAELRVIGIVISVHVLGMFAFSPLVGMLADRIGPGARPGRGRGPAAGVAGAVRLRARGQLVADLRRAVPARAGLVVRDRRRLDADRRPRAARRPHRRPGRRRPGDGPDRRRGGWLAGLVVGPGATRRSRLRDRPGRAGRDRRRSARAPTDACGRLSRMSAHRGHRRHRRHRLLLVPRRPRGARRRDAVRRAVGAGRGRHRRRPAGGVPAPARPAPRVPAAPDQLPRQPLGAAVARRPPGARAVRGRRPAATTVAPGRRRGARPARRPHRRRIPSYVETGAVHLPFADPYCPRLVRGGGRRPTRTSRPAGPMVVIEGPRFSTRAESQQYAAQGWTLINMTGPPEAALAREHAAVLRRDRAGHRHGRRRRGAAPGSARRRSSRCSGRTSSGSRGLLTAAIAALPDPDGCTCSTWADGLETQPTTCPDRCLAESSRDRTRVRLDFLHRYDAGRGSSTAVDGADQALSVARSSVADVPDTTTTEKEAAHGWRRPREGAGRRPRQHREAVRQGLGHAPRRRDPRPARGDPDRVDRPRHRARPRRPAARPGRGDLRAGVLRQDDGRPARGGQRPARRRHRGVHRRRARARPRLRQGPRRRHRRAAGLPARLR